jgi:hypothetical protein
MNWYKTAEAALSITPQEFKAMSFNDKEALAKNTNITPEAQRLFLKPEYWYQWQYRFLAFSFLAGNPSLIPEIQLLLFTEKYPVILDTLAGNPSLIPEIQLLFFTEEYSDKDEVLKILFNNPSFLRGLTPKEMRKFTKIKEARLPVYKKRFKAVKAMVLL